MGDDGQESALEEARDALLEIGDRETAGQAEAFLSRVAWYRGHGEEAQRHIERAQELVADAGTTVAKARVLCLLARLRMLSGDGEEAIRIGMEALALAEALDLDELRIHALTTIGSAKTLLENTGEEELERAYELAKAVNSPLAAIVLNNLSVLAAQRGDFVRAEELVRATLDLAQQLGDRENIRFSHANLLFHSIRRPLGRDARERRPLHRGVRDIAAQHGDRRPRDARPCALRARRRRRRLRGLGARACSRPRNGISGETHPGPSRSRPCARVARATRRSTRATSSRGWTSPGQTPRWQPCSAGSRANPTGSA